MDIGLRALRSEIALLQNLKHPNIIKYLCLDTNTDKQSVNLILEYIPGGSVRNLLDKFGPLDENIIKIYVKQILEGLKYLHSKGVVHHNLKCSNILVANEGTIKISDFAATKLIHITGLSYTMPGKTTKPIVPETLKNSLYWMAPELIINHKANKSADVWSLGCVMVEMRTGKPPWMELGKTPEMMTDIIINSPNGPEIPENSFSPAGKAFLSQCLIRKPSNRSTVETLLKDPFLADENNDEEEAINLARQLSMKLQENISMKKSNYYEETKVINTSATPSSALYSKADYSLVDESLTYKENKYTEVIKPYSQKNTEKDNAEVEAKKERRKKLEAELTKELERRKKNNENK